MNFLVILFIWFLFLFDMLSGNMVYPGKRELYPRDVTGFVNMSKLYFPFDI